jgi:hypothetical protein
MLVGLGNFRSSANESNQWLLAIRVCKAISSSEQSASTKTRSMLMQIPSNLPVKQVMASRTVMCVTSLAYN